MLRVQRFALQIQGQQVVTMPQGSRPLAVLVQDGQPQLWATGDPDALKAERLVVMLGLSDAVENPDAQYCGFFTLANGQAFQVFIGA